MTVFLSLNDDVMQSIITFAGIKATYSIKSTCKRLREQSLEVAIEAIRQINDGSFKHPILQHTLTLLDTKQPTWGVVKTICNELKKTFDSEDPFVDLITQNLKSIEQAMQDKSLVAFGLDITCKGLFGDKISETRKFLKVGNTIQDQAHSFRNWLEENPDFFDGVTEFSFPNDIRRLPPEIRYFKKLESLKLDFSEMTHLPKEVWELPLLKNLSCHSSKLQLLNIPQDVKSTIKHLNIDQTEIDTIPDEIGLLKDLQEFNFVETKIVTLPESFGTLLNLKIFTWKKFRSLPEKVIFSPNPLISHAAFEYRWQGKLIKNLERAVKLFLNKLEIAAEYTIDCLEQMVDIIIWVLLMALYLVLNTIQRALNLIQDHPYYALMSAICVALFICL